MAKGTASQIATKWQNNTNNAVTQGYVMDGVRNYAANNTQSPAQKAATVKTYWLAQLNAAADKWATNCSNSDMGTWTQAMQDKANARITDGVNGAVPRFQAFMGQLLSYIDSQLPNLPPKQGGSKQASLASGKARAMWWIDKMAAFQPTGTK